jgi:hypothetical protein
MDRIVSPLLPPQSPPIAPSSNVGFTPKQHEATDHRRLDSPNAESDWMKARALLQTVGQYLNKETATFKRKEGRKQQAQTKEVIYRTQTERLEFELDQVRTENARLKIEGELLKKTIAELGDEKLVDKLNIELHRLHIENAP